METAATIAISISHAVVKQRQVSTNVAKPAAPLFFFFFFTFLQCKISSRCIFIKLAVFYS